MKSIAWLLLCAAVACSTKTADRSTNVASTASPNVAFGTYSTFSFGLSDQPRPGYEVTPRSLEVQRRLRPLVSEELRARGYADRANQGDLIVKLATGTHAPSRPNRGATELYGTYDSSGGDPPKARGYIAINIYDAATGAAIWQGTATADVDAENIDDALLKAAVRRMLASLPKRVGQTAASSFSGAGH